MENHLRLRYPPQRHETTLSTPLINTIHHRHCHHTPYHRQKSPNIYEGMKVVVEVMSSATPQDLYTALRSPGFTSLCFWKVYSKKSKKENQRQDESQSIFSITKDKKRKKNASVPIPKSSPAGSWLQSVCPLPQHHIVLICLILILVAIAR